MKWLIIINILLFNFFSLKANATILNPVRNLDFLTQFGNPARTLKVTTARVVMADYELLKKDFPYLAAFSEKQIDEWLIKEIGFITNSHLQPNPVNSYIETNDQQKMAYRPFGYGRALVFQVRGGLIDGKGFGSNLPRQEDHRNGLATLGEMIREYVYEKAIDIVFNFEKSEFKTIGSYAVMDWGFDVIHADGTKSPAGAILRQAHKRALRPSGLLDDQLTKKIELIIRKYGFTSAGAYREVSHHDKLNIQGDVNGAVIDFGAYIRLPQFDRLGISYLEGNILIRPQDINTQPIEQLMAPEQEWGTSLLNKVDPKYDNPWVISHNLANEIRQSKNFKEKVDFFLNQMLGNFKKKLRRNQCEFIFSK